MGVWIGFIDDSCVSDMICAFCDRLGWVYLKSLLEEFAERLQFGVRRDLTELVRVPEIDATRARGRLVHIGGGSSLYYVRFRFQHSPRVESSP